MAHTITAQFQGLDLSIIDHNGQKWLTAEQIGLALGYNPANARQGILKLYRNHEDEFTSQDKGVVELATPGGKQQSTIFSATGCHLLSFFSNTPRAKAFRAWAKEALVQGPAAQVIPAPTPRRAKINRTVERQVMELFVAGHGQREIARLLRISPATVSLLLTAKWQFSTDAGTPECTQALLDAVANRHLQVEQERLLLQHQRMVQKFSHSANNQALAGKLDHLARHLQRSTPKALQPLDARALSRDTNTSNNGEC